MKISLEISSIKNDKLKKAYEAYEIAYRELFNTLMSCKLNSLELQAVESERGED